MGAQLPICILANQVIPLFGPLITGQGFLYDVSADGQPVLAVVRPEQATSADALIVVLNWTATLKKQRSGQFQLPPMGKRVRDLLAVTRVDGIFLSYPTSMIRGSNPCRGSHVGRGCQQTLPVNRRNVRIRK